MGETSDLGSHILVVAIIAFYWALLSNWSRLMLPRDDEGGKAEDAPARPTGATSSLAAIREPEGKFDDAAFLAGAKRAFEIVLRAFADGDIESVKPLLAPDVFETFARAITGRRDRKETLQLTFIGLKEAAIAGIHDTREATEITVRFVSEVISATRDADGGIAAGDPERIVETIDTWTFARPAGSKNPDWRLIATDGG
jgi:predicted lipid-binding transport protein (Tim44 family)